MYKSQVIQCLRWHSNLKWLHVKVLVLSLLGSLQSLAQSEAYNWNSLAIGGGGFVSGIITSMTQSGLIYARTDVGGAYRWDAANSRWIPLLDWTSESEVGYQGVESLAIDPSSSITVIHASGNVLIREKASGASHTLDVAHLPAGFYLIRATEGVLNRTLKIIKE